MMVSYAMFVSLVNVSNGYIVIDRVFVIGSFRGVLDNVWWHPIVQSP